MRKAGFGLISALSASILGLVNPAIAHAAQAGTILYVSNAGSCDDSGTGTQAMPYCTLQAAADAAQPGQTVQVAAGTVQPETPVVITHSGTAAAPITITSSDPGSTAPRIYALSVSGAAHVVISDLQLYGAIDVSRATDVTLDRLEVHPQSGSAGVHVSGGSSGITISRDWLLGNGAPAVAVDPGASGVVVTTNWISGNTRSATVPMVSVTGAPGTDVVSNTASGACSEALVSLSGGSGAAVVENNVLTVAGSTTTGCAATQSGVLVSADSLTGTRADYNDLYTANSSSSAYTWGATSYATPASFTQATGQGAHDIDAAPDYTGVASCSPKPMPAEGSPLVDSADPTAPGELSTDLTGAARVHDANGTGTGIDDRGALERQLCLSFDQTTALRNDGPLTLAVEPLVHANWRPIDVTVTWGDGSSGQEVIGSAAALYLRHTFAQPGTYQVALTATGPDGEKATYTRTASTSGSDYLPVAPTRVLDTRNGTGTGGVAKQVPAHSTIRLQLAQTAGSPAGQVTAAVLNVTAVAPGTAGFVSAYPDGGSSVTSFLNFSRGSITANLVTVPVAANGAIDLYNGSSAPLDLVADLQGYYVRSSAAGFVGTQPTRMLDTRVTSPTRSAGAVPAHGQVTLQVTGTHGIPATGVTAVVLNTTETGASATGFVTVFPSGRPLPNASNLNFTSGSTVANLVTVPVGANGAVTLYNASSRPIQLIADLQGYYTAGSGLAYIPRQARLLDTRPGQPGEGSITTVLGAPLGAYQDLPYEPGGSLGWWDTSGTWHMPTAILVNSTVTNTKAAGYLALTPTGTGLPSTSNVNFTAGQTVAGLTAARLDSNGNLWCFNHSNGTTDLIEDVEGYFS